MTKQNKKADNKTDKKNTQINWDDPEIPKNNNPERVPDLPDQEEKPEQPGEQHQKKEIPNDPSIIDLYDKDPNTATVHSSNAHNSFGDAPGNEEKEDAQNLNEDKENSNSANNNKKELDEDDS